MNNRLSKAQQKVAEGLGYERLMKRGDSSELITPGLEAHAEQTFMNAIENGNIPGSGVIAYSRKASGPEGQNCAGRASGFPGVELWERDRTYPWDR